jgi:hypothetical protein
LTPTDRFRVAPTLSLSSINTSFEALDLLTYPIKLDALQGFGGEDLDLGVDQRNFTSLLFFAGKLGSIYS